MHFLSRFKQTYLILFLLVNTQIFAMEESQMHNEDCIQICSEQALYRQLLFAIQAGSPESVQEILDKGANINLPVAISPLMFAINCEKKDIVRLLLARGADVNYLNLNGMPALFCALLKGDMDVIKMLLARGADVLAKHSFDDSNILHYLNPKKNRQAIGELVFTYIENQYGFLQVGTLLNECNECGKDPLDVAIKNYNSEIVSVLLKYGAKPDDHHLSDILINMLSTIGLPLEYETNEQFKIIQCLCRGMQQEFPSKEANISPFENALHTVCETMIRLGQDGTYDKRLADTFDLLRQHGAQFLTEFPDLLKSLENFSEQNPKKFYADLRQVYAKHKTNGKSSMFDLLKNRELPGKHLKPKPCKGGKVEEIKEQNHDRILNFIQELTG